MLAFAALNFLLALRALRLALRAEPGARTGHLLDVADNLLGTVLMGALGLPGEHWDISGGTLVLIGPLVVWKAVRDFRARRAEKARTADEAQAGTAAEAQAGTAAEEG